MYELREARKACANGYIRVNAFDHLSLSNATNVLVPG